MAETLYAETGGNPFFVEELLRHLIETGTARQPGMLTSTPVTGRPLLSISTQEISLDDIGPDETLPAEIIDVVNRGGGELDWTVTTEADWIELEPQAGFFRLTMRPRPGDNRANVLVRDRGRGGSQTLRVSVRVRSLMEPAPVVGIEAQDQPSGHKPAGVGQARARRRRWVPVAAMLLAAAIGVLGAWVYRPRVREASPRSTEASASSVSSLGLLVADFRPLGVTRPEQLENIDLTSLSTSKSFDDTKKRWLRDAGLRRALVVKFTHSKAGRRLELRILEVRGSDEARTLQEKLSICFTIEGTRTFRVSGITGSKGTECDPNQIPTQEVTFTRGPRLFKVKLWGRSPPKSRDLILKLAHAEAAVAR